MDTDLFDLNPEQRECVEHMGSPLLVFAGAGTGKTRVITAKIASLIGRHGYPASSILAVTFTNKACDEMRQRVQAAVGASKARGITVSTFHSLGCSILRQHIHRLGYTPRFLVYDEEEQVGVLRRLAEELGVPDSLSPRLLAWAVQRLKNGAPPSGAPAVVHEVLERYEDRLRNYNALDFDDLLLKPVELLERFPEVREEYRRRFRYVLIDEYQDTNPLQYRLIRLLLNPENAICAVGDDDQSIYAWRGSDIGIILNFRRDFPDARIIRLVRNYRSTPTILRAAGAVVSRNPNRVEKELISPRPPGEPVRFEPCEDEEAEARTVRRLLLEIRSATGRPWSDFAVIFRTNFQSRPFELELRQEAIPYRVVGGREFFDRKEVRDLLAYLKVFANPKDQASLLRIINTPRRGLGDTSVRAALDYAAARGLDLYTVVTEHAAALGLPASCRRAMESLADLLTSFAPRFRSGRGLAETVREFVETAGFPAHLLEESESEEQAERRLRNLSEVANHIAVFQRQDPEAGLYEYLERVALLSETDEEREERSGGEDRVTLLTAHASKGLEFGTVFVVGLEDGLFPHRKTAEERETAVEEERRLLYVAMTRAKDRLILTACNRRKVFGKEAERTPSPFLEDIPQELLRRPPPLPPPGSAEAEEMRKAGLRRLLDRLR